MNIIDISVPIYEGMTAWPGGCKFHHKWDRRIDRGDVSNDSMIECDIHTGTHIDAPLHFVEGGKSVDQLHLDVLCGPAQVVDLAGIDAISEQKLSGLNIPNGVERILFKTDNSRLWRQKGFSKDYVALTGSGASWIAKSGIKLVGIDYLSIAPYPDVEGIHHLLLSEGVVVLEGLDLTNVAVGEYELICLPLKLIGAEGSPARAVLCQSEKKELPV